jgi:hypothetical protein
MKPLRGKWVGSVESAWRIQPGGPRLAMLAVLADLSHSPFLPTPPPIHVTLSLIFPHPFPFGTLGWGHQGGWQQAGGARGWVSVGLPPQLVTGCCWVSVLPPWQCAATSSRMAGKAPVGKVARESPAPAPFLLVGRASRIWSPGCYSSALAVAIAESWGRGSQDLSLCSPPALNLTEVEQVHGFIGNVGHLPDPS